jgi:hypothetical protein
MIDNRLPEHLRDEFLSKSFVLCCWIMLTTYPIGVYNNLFAQPNLYQFFFVSFLAVTTTILLAEHTKISNRLKMLWFIGATTLYISTIILRNAQDGALVLNIIFIPLFAPLLSLKRSFILAITVLLIQTLLIIFVLPERNGWFVTFLWSVVSFACIGTVSGPISFLLEQIDRNNKS